MGVSLGIASSLAPPPHPQPAPSASSAESIASDARGAPRDADLDADRMREAEGSRAVGSEGALDPMFQILVPLTPRSPPAAPPVVMTPDAALAAASTTPVDQLLSKLVRRVAWSGNGRSGSARLELGAGALEGATLTIHADEGVVRVSLDLPPGVDSNAWRERITARLGARGLRLETLDIT